MRPRTPAPPFIKSAVAAAPPPGLARAALDAAPSAGRGFGGRRWESLGNVSEGLRGWGAAERGPDRPGGDGTLRWQRKSDEIQVVETE